MWLDGNAFSLLPKKVFFQSCHWAFQGEVISSIAPMFNVMCGNNGSEFLCSIFLIDVYIYTICQNMKADNVRFLFHISTFPLHSNIFNNTRLYIT